MIQKTIDYYLNVQRNRERTPSGKFNVSDAGRCHLMRFWKRQAKPTKIEPDERTFRVFEVGHIFEKWVVNILRKEQKLVLSQFPVEDEHRKGYLDVVLWDEGKLILTDIKTVHSRKFHYMKNSAKEDTHYYHQVLTYEDMLPFEVDSVRLAYLSKDDLCINEIEVPDLREQMKLDWKYLIEDWISQEPTLPPSPLAWECAYCNYREECEFKVIKKK